MAFGFGRKKASGDEASGPEAVGQPAAPAPKAKKRKPNEMLSSVIKESTEGAATALMRSNKSFLIDGGSKAVVLLLDVANIGGLSQRQRGDESKGSIIELIQADQITTIATAGMLEEDIFGIIPTENTVSRMDEYDLLVNAPYTWGTVDLGSFQIAEGGPATFASAKQVSEGIQTVEQAIGAASAHRLDETAFMPPVASGAVGSDEVDGADDIDYGDDDGDLDDLPEPQGFGDETPFDDETVHEDEPAFDEYADEDDVFDPEVEQFDGLEEDAPFDDENGYQDGAGEGEYYEPDDREVSEAEIEDTIARRYLSGDLGLEVDLAPFEHYLGTSDPIALFNENADVDDWLGNQMAQMAKQANADIEAHRYRSLAELRQQYQALMSMHVEQVVAELDIDNPKTMYGSLKAAAVDDHRERYSDGERIISERKREILDRFEAELKERADQAAMTARVQYKDRNQSRIDRELSEVGAQVAAQNDDVLAQQQEQLLATRRSDATKRMDLGMNRILEALGERHRAMVKAEAALYSQHSQRMQDFLDEYRKEDVARSHALQEELARNDKVDAAGREYAARMDAMAAEHRAEITKLREGIDQLHVKAREEMKASEDRWRGLLEVQEANTQAANTRADDYSKRLSLVGEQTEAQYKNRLADMDAERQRAVDEADRATKVTDRGTKLMASLALVMALAALAIGILLGMMWANSRGAGLILPTHSISSMFDGSATVLHGVTAIPSSTQTSP